MSANSRSVSARDRLLVGSSSTSTRHPTASARPISTSCWAAGESVPDRGVDRNLRMAEPCEHVGGRSAHLGAPDEPEARGLHAEQDVLGRRTDAARATAPGRSSPRPLARASSGCAGRYGAPSSVIRPASGCSAPDRIAISVLLPAPFWPTMAQTSPGRTDTSTPSTATVAPNAFRIPRISKRGVPVMASLMAGVRAAASRPASASDRDRASAVP